MVEPSRDFLRIDSFPFGGKPVDSTSGRRLAASVEEDRGAPGWFRIHLWVESTDPAAKPLAGQVRFFIHDKLKNSMPFIQAVEGRAELRLKAWGAFTVGALADGGATSLELDLASDASFPAAFRDR